MRIQTGIISGSNTVVTTVRASHNSLEMPSVPNFQVHFPTPVLLGAGPTLSSMSHFPPSNSIPPPYHPPELTRWIPTQAEEDSNAYSEHIAGPGGYTDSHWMSTTSGPLNHYPGTSKDGGRDNSNATHGQDA